MNNHTLIYLVSSEFGLLSLLKAKSTPALLFPHGRQYFHAGLTFREIQGASWIQDGIDWVTAETYKGTAVSVNVNCTL